MVRSALIGLLVAVVVMLPKVLRAGFPNVAWSLPFFILGIAAVAMVIQRYVLDRGPGHRNYDGLADLFVHIHTPSGKDSAIRWMMRGCISFLLALFGGVAGPEGAGVEIGQAAEVKWRSRSSRWFEQLRRTDAAVALSAGVAAAFGAPFAAVLLPVELGIGGRTIMSAISAISAFLGVWFLGSLLPSDRFHLEGFDLAGALYGFHFVAWREWLGILAITALAGLVCVGIIRFFRYSQESLLDLFQTQAWMRVLAGGIFLFLVVLVYKNGHLPSGALLEQVLWSRRIDREVIVIFFTHLLSLSLILAAFGTIGILWPLFALGGFFGFLINSFVLQSIPGFSAVAGLAGGVAFWGAVLGAPLAGALVAFELTQNLAVLLPCLIAGYGARQIRIWFKTRALIDRDLEARGVSLIEGRSASILDAVMVREAMVVDHETIHEREPVSELHGRLVKLRYPFLPVVDGQGVYMGLLTIDLVQEGWRLQDPLTSNSPLANLLEAKDLLYRSGFKVPTVKATDKLSSTTKLFEEVPCVPVLGEEGRVIGLLFAHNVRLAYDREVARRTLSLQHGAGV